VKASRILITGGAGYIGSHLTNLLRERCIVYDSLLYTKEYLKDVEFVRGDVTDYPLLQKYLARVDCVVWLAGIAGDAACMVNPRKAIAINQEAVQFLSEHFNGPIIYTSSSSAYGVSDETVNEESPLNPQSLYAETKIRSEKYLAGKQALVLRLGTLHGVSERMRFDLVVNVLTMHAVVKSKIEVFGGRQYRPLLSVKDAAEFVAALVDQDWQPGVYNVASENLSILEVAGIVKTEIPHVQMEIVGSQFEDKRNYRVDSSKAEGLLGFMGKRFVGDSVRDIAQLIHSGRIKDFSDLQYANLSALQNSENNKT
jgi:nucleoside-diphosphate-sugar epimerase